MIAFPNCKINLGLYVTEKRADGFHHIESIFLPVALTDVLEVIVSQNESVEFSISGIEIKGNKEDNICIKAYQLLRQDFQLTGIKMALLKNIPTGAGLGGGSSDGAFMLKLLSDIFHLQLNQEQLKNYAAKLGSDCPFFIENIPAFVSGRGEVMEEIKLDISKKTIVIVQPKIHISTPKAYQLVTPKKAAYDLRDIQSLAIHEWKNYIGNDFENPIGSLHPEILEIKNKLYAAGAVYASMSGSGSAVYGIFENEIEPIKALFADCFYWQGGTV